MAEETKFTIGEPISREQIPASKAQSSKYTELFRTVDALDQGQWLPVTMETERQGQRLVDVAKMRGYQKKRRGLVVYLARKEANDG